MVKVQLMIHRLILITSIALLAATGFLREFVFVNINEQLRFLWFQSEPSQMSNVLSFLAQLSFDQLYYLKWVLTVSFGLLFYLETILICKIIFSHWFAQEAGYIFFGLFLLSAIIFGFFYVFIDQDQGYTIARYLMGIAQSPIPCMILVPALFLKRSHKGESAL